MNYRAKIICVYLTCGVAALLANQACGGFQAGRSVGGAYAADYSGSLIHPSNSSPIVGETVTFTLPIDSAAATARLGWTHILTDPVTGAFLPACLEVAGNALPTYTLVCTVPGLLEIDSEVTDIGSTSGPFQLKLNVAAAAPSPTPTPSMPGSPSSSPTGAQLYEAKCASCHGTLASNSVRQKTVAGVTTALSNISAMQSINLSTDQINMIVNALNGK